MFEEGIKKLKKEALELNDYIADNPELGLEEYKASEAIVKLLRKHNIEVEYPFSNLDTAFKGVINKGKKKKFAILAEYDALPGMGHACGHSASGAISVLAALVLNEYKDKIDAQVDIIGTPDEEIRGGKIMLAKEGVFNEYDAAIMIHMFSKNAVSMPFLALDTYEYKFYGVPAHAAAAPWEGKNALNGLRLTFDALDMMRQHVKDDVRIQGFIAEGGTASNIVPSFARAEITLRAMDRNYLNDVVKWAHDIGEAAAKATRTKVEIELIGEKYDNMSQKPTGNRVLEELFGDLNLPLIPIEDVPKGSSDIGNVDFIIPAFHPIISIGEGLEVHPEEFASEIKSEKTHQAIVNGATIITKFIKTLADNDEILEAIKEEHKINRGLK